MKVREACQRASVFDADDECLVLLALATNLPESFFLPSSWRFKMRVWTRVFNHDE